MILYSYGTPKDFWSVLVTKDFEKQRQYLRRFMDLLWTENKIEKEEIACFWSRELWSWKIAGFLIEFEFEPEPSELTAELVK